MFKDLTEDALDDCVALYVETFTAEPWNETWTLEAARQRLGDFAGAPRSHGICLVDADGVLLGFALGHRERFEDGDHFLLKEMCVRGSRQREGAGTRILQELTTRLDDVQHWYLLTARDSDASSFYTRNGFRPAGRMGVFVRSS